MSEVKSPVATGGCQCGAVRYALYVAPENSHVCHCRMCQRATGGLFAALAVFVPDMRHFVPFGMMIWMYATPIFYPLAIVPERLHWLYQLNPMTYLVEAYRGAVLEHQAPSLATLGVFCAASIAVFIAGYWAFNRLKYEFADVL